MNIIFHLAKFTAVIIIYFNLKDEKGKLLGNNVGKAAPSDQNTGAFCRLASLILAAYVNSAKNTCACPPTRVNFKRIHHQTSKFTRASYQLLFSFNPPTSIHPSPHGPLSCLHCVFLFFMLLWKLLVLSLCTLANQLSLNVGKLFDIRCS